MKKFRETKKQNLIVLAYVWGLFRWRILKGRRELTFIFKALICVSSLQLGVN